MQMRAKEWLCPVIGPLYFHCPNAIINSPPKSTGLPPVGSHVYYALLYVWKRKIYVGLSICMFGETKFLGETVAFDFVSFQCDRQGKRPNKGIFWERSLFPNSSSLYIES